MHLKSLFIKYFDKDLQANLFWIQQLEIYENQLPEEINKLYSRLINAHHIWNSRLFQQQAESDWDDELLPLYFERLIQDNYRQTIEFIEHGDELSQTHYYLENGEEQLSTDILMRILLQSAEIRALIQYTFENQGLQNQKFDLL